MQAPANPPPVVGVHEVNQTVSLRVPWKYLQTRKVKERQGRKLGEEERCVGRGRKRERRERGERSHCFIIPEAEEVAVSPMFLRKARKGESAEGRGE